MEGKGKRTIAFIEYYLFDNCYNSVPYIFYFIQFHLICATSGRARDRTGRIWTHIYLTQKFVLFPLLQSIFQASDKYMYVRQGNH